MSEFFSDFKSYASQHTAFSAVTLGAAPLLHAVRMLGGRLVVLLIELWETSRKTDGVTQQNFKSSSESADEITKSNDKIIEEETELQKATVFLDGMLSRMDDTFMRLNRGENTFWPVEFQHWVEFGWSMREGMGRSTLFTCLSAEEKNTLFTSYEIKFGDLIKKHKVKTETIDKNKYNSKKATEYLDEKLKLVENDFIDLYKSKNHPTEKEYNSKCKELSERSFQRNNLSEKFPFSELSEQERETLFASHEQKIQKIIERYR